MEEKLVKLNAKDIRREFMKFIGYFAVLSLLALLSIYFFNKSYSVQQKNIEEDIVAYKEILNKQQVLQIQFENIRERMAMLNTGRAPNEATLERVITQNLQETQEIIGDDTDGEFEHYSYLLQRLDSIMELKNDIIVISNRERMARNNYEDCLENMSDINKDLSQDRRY